MNSDLFEDFDKNPIEALVLAQNENVHSAMIAWLVRNLNPPARNALLTGLTGKKIEFSNAHAQTEWKEIDILIDFEVDGERHHVAIENKLKASVRKLQLEDATEALRTHGRLNAQGILFSYFATLPENSKGWKIRSYENLLGGLLEAQRHDDSIYLRDYVEVIERLTVARRYAIDRADATDLFTAQGDSAFLRYVRRGKLRVILQQIWLSELARQVLKKPTPWKLSFDSTRGHGLINFFQRTAIEDVEIEWGVQLHHNRLKVFAAPASYGQFANQAQLHAVEQILRDDIKNQLFDHGLIEGDAAPTLPRGRGFRSFPLSNEGEPAFGNRAFWITKVAETLAALEGIQ